jgi:hypothetical protein
VTGSRGNISSLAILNHHLHRACAPSAINGSVREFDNEVAMAQTIVKLWPSEQTRNIRRQVKAGR